MCQMECAATFCLSPVLKTSSKYFRSTWCVILQGLLSIKRERAPRDAVTIRDYGFYANAAREIENMCSYSYYLWSDRMLPLRWKRKEETQRKTHKMEEKKIFKFPCKCCHRTGSCVLLLRVPLQLSSILKPLIVSLQRCRRDHRLKSR